MLILERKLGTSIIINGNIRVYYSSYNHQTGKIKIGIDAPKNVTVDREEIHQRKLDGVPRNANSQ